jgi:hypothetical protein
VPLDRRIRLLGVRVGALSKPGAFTQRAASPRAAESAPLFDNFSPE